VPAGYASAAAYAINNNGDLAGSVGDFNGYSHAFTWRNGQPIELALPAGALGAYGYAINSGGAVAGNAGGNTALFQNHGVFWPDPANPIDLLTDPNLWLTNAVGINDSAQVLAWDWNPALSTNGTAVWQNGSAVDIGQLPNGYQMGAGGINNAGQVVATGYRYGDVGSGVVWQNGILTPIPGLAPDSVFAASRINNYGVVAGSAPHYPRAGTYYYHAAVWTPDVPNGVTGTTREVGTPVGFDWGQLSAINDSGVAVGWAVQFVPLSSVTSVAILYANGTMVNLNDYLPENSGWVLQGATSINNSNQIVAYGTHDGLQSTCVLTFDTLPSAPLAVAGLELNVHGYTGGTSDLMGSGQMGAGWVFLNGPATASAPPAGANLGPGIYVPLTQTLSQPLTFSGSNVCVVDGQAYAYIAPGFSSAQFYWTAPVVTSDVSGTLTADLGDGARSVDVSVRGTQYPYFPSTLNYAYTDQSTVVAGSKLLLSAWAFNSPNGNEAPSWASPSQPGVYLALQADLPGVTFYSADGDDTIVTGPDGTMYGIVPPGNVGLQVHVLTQPYTPSGLATITVSVNGSAVTASFSVTGGGAPFLGLTADPQTVYNGDSAAVSIVDTTITDWTAPSWGAAQGAYIPVSTDNPAAQIISGGGDCIVTTGPDGQTYVILPPSARTGRFHVATTAVSQDTTVNITVNDNGQSASTSISIKSRQINSITLTPSTVSAGEGTSGVVNLATPATDTEQPWGTEPGELVVLSSSDPSAKFTQSQGSNGDGSSVYVDGGVPNTVATMYIPTGQSFGSFSMVTDGAGSTPTVTVSAQLFNFDENYNFVTYGNLQTADLTIDPTGISSLTLDPSTVTAGSGTTVTVTLSSPATDTQQPWGTLPGELVELTSSDPSASFVASSGVFINDGAQTGQSGNIFIPTGQTTATFTMSTTAVSNQTTVTVSAQLFNFDSFYNIAPYGNLETATLTVNTAAIAGLTIDPSTVTAGSGANATLTLGSPAIDTVQPWGLVGGEYVQLTSSDPSAKFVPIPQFNNPSVVSLFTYPDTNQPGATGTLFIPTGQRTVSFQMITSLTTSSITATVTAQLVNFDSNSNFLTYGNAATATLTVNPVAIASFTVDPSEVTNGAGSTATVTLSAPATNEQEPWGLDVFEAVHVSTGNPNVKITPVNFSGLQTPYVVTAMYGSPDTDAVLYIPAGQTTGALNLVTSHVTAQTTATLTASTTIFNSDYSLNDYGTPLTATLTVDTTDIATLTLDPTTVTAGQGTTATLTLASPAVDTVQPWGPIGGEYIELTSSDPSAKFVPISQFNNPFVVSLFTFPDTNQPGVYGTLFIPTGQRTASFQIVSSFVSSVTTATVTAQLVNFDSNSNIVAYGNAATAGLTINPIDVASFTVNPGEVLNGSPSTGIVTLTAPAVAMPEPWGLEPFQAVEIFSTDPSVQISRVPYTDPNTPFVAILGGQSSATMGILLIPAGQTTATVPLLTSSVSSTRSVAIVASPTIYDSYFYVRSYGTMATATLTVDATTISSLTLAPTEVTSGQGSTGTVTLTNPAVDTQQPWGTNNGQFMLLTSSDPSAKFLPTPAVDGTSPSVWVGQDGQTPDTTAYLFIPTGSTSASFEMTTGAVSAQTAVTVTGQFFNFDANYTVVPYGAAQSATLTIDPGVVDTTAPATNATLNGPAGQNGWYTGPVTVTLAASDPDGAADVAATYYTVDGGAQQTYSAAFQVSGDGPHTVSFWSVDQAGNTEAAQSQTINIDGTPPSTTSRVIPGSGGSPGFNPPTLVVLSATDATSGVGQTNYILDGAAAQPYIDPIQLRDGNHTVVYWSVDVAGNVENQNTRQVVVDFTPPVITFGTPLQTPNGGWYNTPVDVPFTATDANGIASLAPSTSPLHLTAEGGSVTGTVTAIDNFGNTATRTSPTIGIDYTAPTSTAASSGSGPVTVTLSAADAVSGVSSTVYTVDGGAQQTYAQPISITAYGSHTVQYWSTDHAGNVEAAKSLPVTIADTTPPSSSMSLSGTPGTNGWYTGTVTVTLSATDAGSGVAAIKYFVDGATVTHTYTVPFTISSDAAHTVTFWAIDQAGNTETNNNGSVKIDKTAPSIAFGSTSPAPTSYGWNNTAVSVPYTSSDPTSGIASSTPASPVTISAEGANQTTTVTATDNAGNSASSTSATVNIDLTAPSTTATPAGTQGGNGTYTGPVTVTLAGSDALSGIAWTLYTVDGGAQQNYASPFTVSGGSAHTINYWSVDKAGNVEAQKTLSITVDTTPPTTTAALSSPAGSNGWYTGAVTVTLSATDPDGAADVAATYYAVDGGAQQTYASAFSVSGDGTHAVSYWSVDKAGNAEAHNSVTIKIDGTQPTISFGSPTPAANTAGWNNTAVNFPYTAGDLTSGIASALPASPASITTEGTGQSVKITATDLAGNVLLAPTQSVNIDLTAPSTTATPSGSQGPNGAYTGPVTVTLAGTDTLSGIAAIYYTIDGGAQQTYTSAFTVSGSSHTVKYWSVDKAGNVEAQKTLSIVLDTNPPTTVCQFAGTAGMNGWYKGPVTVTLTASDPEGSTNVASTSYIVDSGTVQTYTTAFTITAEGTHTITFWSTDKAGNVEAPKNASVKIDTVKPAVAFGAVTPTPNAAGWNHGTVTVAYTASDATSGIASATPGSPLTFASAGNNQTQTVTATDNAGNSQFVTSPSVKIDLTAPSTTSSVSGAVVTLTATDALSGVASTFYKIDSGSQTTYTAPFTVTGAGTHTVTYWSVDVAGNVESTHTTSVTINPVPTASSLSPNVTTANGPAFTLTVTGTNFVSTSVVTWNGANLATTFVSSTSLTATVPASDITAVGTATVNVVNPVPGGGTSSGLAFTIKTNPSPTLSSISPTSVVAGTGALTLALTGTNFVPASVVKANGTALATTYVSATSLTAAVPASTVTTAGSVNITVTNPAPGGGTSGTKTLTVAAATISGVTLNPTSVKGTVSSTGTVTLTGPAPAGGFVVTLTSSSPKASVPSSFTIAAGSTTGNFTITTTKVNSNTTSTITAKNGATSKTATLTITP